MPECRQWLTVCGQQREFDGVLKSAPSWPMFFAYMKFDPESLKPLPQWPFECFDSRLVKNCGGRNLLERCDWHHEGSTRTLTKEKEAFMRQESGSRMARLGPVFVMALMGCSVTYGQDVRTNYRPGTDFSKYHSYKWVDEVKGAPSVGIHPDQILDSQIKQAIDSQMAAKGFTKTDDDKADLLLGYEIGLQQEKQWNASAWGWGGGPAWGGWGPWGMESASGTANSSTITIGTLVLSIYDPAVKQLVWIGAAQHTIDPPKKQEKNQKNLNKGAQKLLKDFPPGRK